MPGPGRFVVQTQGRDTQTNDYQRIETKTPEGGWQKFFADHPDKLAASSAHRERYKDEVYQLEVQRRKLVEELRTIDARLHWVEGLDLVALGLGDVRTRRVGLRSTLNVYRYDKTSPTNVLHSGAAAPDDEEHRREVAAAGGRVYAGAY